MNRWQIMIGVAAVIVMQATVTVQAMDDVWKPTGYGNLYKPKNKTSGTVKCTGAGSKYNSCDYELLPPDGKNKWPRCKITTDRKMPPQDKPLYLTKIGDKPVQNNGDGTQCITLCDFYCNKK